MTVTVYIWLVPLLLCCASKGEVMNTCNKTITLQSKPSKMIAIHDINTTSSIAREILEQCNGRTECQVKNSAKECVHIEFWKNTEQVIEEFQSYTDFQLVNKKKIYLASNNYSIGKYQEAEDLTCKVTFLEQDNDKEKTITFAVYELAPFINSTDYCLYLNDSNEPKLCSGSKKIKKDFEMSVVGNETQFSFRLSANATYVPKIRVWIGIIVVPPTTFNLECTLDKVQLRTSTEPNVSPFYIVVVCMTIILIGMITSEMIGYKNCSPRRSENADKIYSEINSSDLAMDLAISSLMPQTRALPDISSEGQFVGNTTQALMNTILMENMSLGISQSHLDHDNFARATVHSDTDDVEIMENTLYGFQPSS